MSNLFNNILKSEMYRNRADGLTTKLYELAKDLGYTFVAANSEQVKHLAYNNIVAINGQQPSFHGSRSRGFIFDHYALHVGCMEAQNKIEKLEDTNEELKTKVSLLEQDLDSVKREKQILTNSFLKTMNEINKLKDALRVYGSHKRSCAYLDDQDGEYNIPCTCGFSDVLNEETEMKTKLTIELVPRTCFYSNVRSIVSQSDWDKLRKDCYSKAKYVCEICGGKGTSHPVECHEVWSYNDENDTQKLERLIALCPACHAVKHWGLSRIRGRENECIRHLIYVNNITLKEANRLVNNEFAIWKERSDKQWILDLSYLDNLGIKYVLDR